MELLSSSRQYSLWEVRPHTFDVRQGWQVVDAGVPPLGVIVMHLRSDHSPQLAEGLCIEKQRASLGFEPTVRRRLLENLIFACEIPSPGG